MPQPERPFLGLSSNWLAFGSAQRQKAVFRQHHEYVWFLPTHDSIHNEHSRPTGAGVALVVRSVLVGICRLSEFAFSIQCVALSGSGITLEREI